MSIEKARQYYFPASTHEPERLNTLTAYDFDEVTIRFADGSIWMTEALVEREGPYVVVYTEHYGYHVFHDDDEIQWEPTTKGEAVWKYRNGVERISLAKHWWYRVKWATWGRLK